MVFRVYPALAVVLFASSGGCAAPLSQASPSTPDGKQEVKAAPEVDPSRAFLKLEEIEPRVTPPQRPGNLEPVPEKSVAPMAESRRLIEEQRYTEAALELERALRHAPNHPDIHAHLALLHWQAGNLERAKSHAARTIEGNPDSVIGHYVLGRCLAASGDRPGAMTALRMAAISSGFKVDPEVAALAHFHLAEMLAAEGYLTAALGQYEAFGQVAAVAKPAPNGELASLVSTRRGSVALAKSVVLEKLGRFDEAARSLAPVVEAAPADAELQIRHARLLLRSGRFDEAAEVLQRIEGTDEEVIALLTDTRQRAGKSELIVSDMQARYQKNRDSAPVLHHLARALVDRGRGAEARDLLAEFLQRHPESGPARQSLMDTLIRSHQWDEALRYCAQGIRQKSMDADEVDAVVHSVLALPEATDAVIRGAEQQPGDGVHLYLSARVAIEAGKTADAERMLRKALTQEAGLIPARAALADLLTAQCSYDEALEVARRAEPETPEDGRLEAALGLIHDRLDDTEKAEQHYRAAIQLDRTDTRSMYRLAGIYRRTARPLQAQRQLRSLLEMDPRNEEARELLALALLDDEKKDLALREYQELQKVTRKATTAARCRILLDSHLRTHVEARQQVLLEAVAAGDPDAATYVAIAETFEDTDLNKAHEYYAKAARLDPNDEEALFGLIRTDQYMLRLDHAVAGMEEMLHCRPNRHAVRRVLIGLLSLQEQFDRALQYAEAQEARPEIGAEQREHYRDAIVDVLREAGRGQEAIERIQKWIETNDDAGYKGDKLAAEFARQGNFAEAARVYETLHQEMPEDMAIRDRLLAVLQEANQHLRAEQYLLDWFEQDPHNERLVEALILTLGRATRRLDPAPGEPARLVTSRTDDALELLSTWLPRAARREGFQNVKVSVLLTAGRYEECADWLAELTEEITTILRAGLGARPSEEQMTDERRARRPSDLTIDRLSARLEVLNLRRILVLGQAAREDLLAGRLTGRIKEAEELWEQAMQSDPDLRARLQLLNIRTTLHRLQHQEDHAVEAMEAMLELKPRDESVSNDLAYSWIDRGLRLADAEALIRHSVGRLPRQPAYLDTYGWLLYKKGDFEGARLWLDRANRVGGGDDPVIHDHLGDALWRLGQHAEARKHWEAAVAIVQNRLESEFANDDERRVRATTAQKLLDAATGSPGVAPTGEEQPQKGGPAEEH